MPEASRGERFAYRGFLPYISAFLFLVGTGYHFTFSSSQPNLSPGYILLETLAAVCVIWFFLRMTAMARYQSQLKNRFYWGWKEVIWFIVLFVFSGYGVFSALMLFFEGPVIIRESVGATVIALSKLKTVAEDGLRVPEYEKMKANVRTLQSRLKAEIYNPTEGNCGIGTNARNVIEEISHSIAGFTVIRGTDNNHSCNDRKRLDGIFNAYSEVIDEGLKNHPLVTMNNIPGRERLLAEIQSKTQERKNDLSVREGELAGLATLIANVHLYSSAIRSLQGAANEYSSLREALIGFIKDSRKLLPEVQDLGISSVTNLNSGLQLLSVAFSRLDRSNTYLYFIIPFFVDLLSSFITIKTITYYRKVKKGTSRMNLCFRNANLGDVEYLWRPDFNR